MLNLEALNNLLMFVVSPLVGALVGVGATHQAKAGLLAGILFALGGLLWGIFLAFVAKRVVDSLAKRALRQTSMVGSSLMIGAVSFVVVLQILAVVGGVAFLCQHFL